MLISESSMFEFHVRIIDGLMFNILELIMKTVYNYPTTLSTQKCLDLKMVVESRRFCPIFNKKL
jgi:hypothetical protein